MRHKFVQLENSRWSRSRWKVYLLTKLMNYNSYFAEKGVSICDTMVEWTSSCLREKSLHIQIFPTLPRVSRSFRRKSWGKLGGAIMEKIRQRQQEERRSPLGKLIKSPSEHFSHKTILHYYPLCGLFSFSTLKYIGKFEKTYFEDGGDISLGGRSQPTCGNMKSAAKVQISHDLNNHQSDRSTQNIWIWNRFRKSVWLVRLSDQSLLIMYLKEIILN